MVTRYGKAECSGCQVRDSEYGSVYNRGIHYKTALYVLLVGQSQEAAISRLILRYLEMIGLSVSVWICLLMGSTDLRLEFTFCATHARV